MPANTHVTVTVDLDRLVVGVFLGRIFPQLFLSTSVGPLLDYIFSYEFTYMYYCLVVFEHLFKNI